MSKGAFPKFENMIIKFTKKPAKSGEYYSFIVPKLYIENGLFDPKEKYTVYVCKAEKSEIEEPKEKEIEGTLVDLKGISKKVKILKTGKGKFTFQEINESQQKK